MSAVTLKLSSLAFAAMVVKPADKAVAVEAVVTGDAITWPPTGAAAGGPPPSPPPHAASKADKPNTVTVFFM